MEDLARCQLVVAKARAGVINLKQLDRRAGPVLDGCVDMVRMTAHRSPKSDCCKSKYLQPKPRKLNVLVQFWFPFSLGLSSSLVCAVSFFSTRSSRFISSGSR